ncbi:MAG: DMT family transporter [Acidobacteriota bacterium]|nr:MAG: DMT family transporter [Acidobacteriota bacterium]
MTTRRTQLAGEAALVCCAMLWGATFPVTRELVRHVSPITLNAARFVLAALVLVPFALSFARGLRGRLVIQAALPWGLALGALLAGGYATQSAGLQYIGAARSAFLTAFYVLLTPLIEWTMLRRRPAPAAIAGAATAMVGIALLSGASSMRITLGAGDWLTLLCALLFAAQIVLMTAALRRFPSLPLLVTEITVCGLLSVLAAPVMETQRWGFSLPILAGLLFLALIATAFVFALQNYGQRRTTPTRAAVLFASEPLWAALIAAAAGEPLDRDDWAGAGLILAGLLMACVPASNAPAPVDLEES